MDREEQTGMEWRIERRERRRREENETHRRGLVENKLL